MTKGVVRQRAAVGLVAFVFAFEAIGRCLRPVGDQDSFWIAAAGRDMWASGHAPLVNAFSFTDAAHEWVFHELAFGLLYAKGLAWLGPAFLDLFGVLAGAVTFGIVAFHVARTTSHRLTLALVGLPVLVEVPIFHPRPPFASLPFVAATVALAFAPRFTAKHAVLAVATVWGWTLSHGSFPLGVAILLVAAVDARGVDRAERRRLLLVAAVGAAVVTVLNPYGLRLHGLVSRYLVGDSDAASAVHAHVTEFFPVWRAPNAFGPFDAPAVVLVLVTAAACLRRPESRVRAGFVLALAIFAAFEVRNVHLALVTGAMLLAPDVDALSSASDAPLAPSARVTALVAVVPGVVASLALWSVLFAMRPTGAWFGPNIGGPDLLAILSRIPDGARVYAPFGISPPVIWYTTGRGVRLFYDSRNDCYSPAVALASFTMEDPGEAPATTLAGYGVEYALVRRGGPVAEALAGSAAWTLASEEGALLLFRRAG